MLSSSVQGPGEALEGERGAKSIAAQALDAFAIVLVDGDVGVQGEAGDEDRAVGLSSGDLVVDRPRSGKDAPDRRGLHLVEGIADLVVGMSLLMAGQDLGNFS